MAMFDHELWYANEFKVVDKMSLEEMPCCPSGGMSGQVCKRLLKHHDPQQNDIQHNDIQHNSIQHNDIQHNSIQHNDIQQNDIQHNDI